MLDASIKQVAPVAAPNRPVLLPQKEKESVEVRMVLSDEPAPAPSQRLGWFSISVKSYPRFTVDVVIGEPNENQDAFTGKVEKPISAAT